MLMELKLDKGYFRNRVINLMRFIWILIITFMWTLGWAYENPPDLTELPIEALMNIEKFVARRKAPARSLE